MITLTPNPPYYTAIITSVRAVIITSERAGVNESYAEMSMKMMELASQQEGFLGKESARENIGITVSYWKDRKSIKRWKKKFEYHIAGEAGRRIWCQEFKVRIAKVEREYDMDM